MGKQNKLREAQVRAADEAICARLRAHARHKRTPPFIDCYAQFDPVYRRRIEAYRHLALRAPEIWRCRLRMRAPEKRFLDLVEFAFAKYAAPVHLQGAWTDELHAGTALIDGAPVADELAHRRYDFCEWYIVVAQGRSLYEKLAGIGFSRRETHHFVNAPAELTSSVRALWYAIGKAESGDSEAALRICRSKITGFRADDPFWREAARFFARNPASVLEMNDLIDFLNVREYSLTGRTLASLRRAMQEWHHALRARALVHGRSWTGNPLPDARYEMLGENGPAIWRFRQIKTEEALFREGERMHHCVVSYHNQCLRGATSIWSLTCECPPGNHNRGLTIELTSVGEIAQCRGFANRAPYASELAIVALWAREHGLRLLV
jgi:PcfJ-like protein